MRPATARNFHILAAPFGRRGSKVSAPLRRVNYLKNFSSLRCRKSTRRKPRDADAVPPRSAAQGADFADLGRSPPRPSPLSRRPDSDRATTKRRRAAPLFGLPLRDPPLYSRVHVFVAQAYRSAAIVADFARPARGRLPAAGLADLALSRGTARHL